MKNINRIAIVTVLGCLSATAAVFAGSGQASTVSISYYQTYSTGTTVPMYGDVTVTGFNNQNYSTNSVWLELHNKNNTIVKQAEAPIGFNGTLYTAQNVATNDYHLDLNPDGPNYDSVVANGKAQN
ncbi:hypothetical protein ACFW1P_16455 [Paenibacillus sp. NPDC058910]|uniref:hypothetical protein n=1 Tax=unclassified Paenibacillus TaxID=185978 RepID=UPI0036C126EF